MPTPTEAGAAGSTLALCPGCDLALSLRALQPGETAHCPRCRAELASGLRADPDTPLALLCTAACLSLLMNVFPLVQMRVQGITRTTTLFGAVLALQHQGMTPLALLVLFTTILGPVAEIVLLSMVVLPVRFPALGHADAATVSAIQRLRPWSMVEVFMLGVLVSLVKLAALAQIVPGVALWACAADIVVMAVLKSMIRPEDLWAWAAAGQAARDALAARRPEAP